jgi:hypothetical protein
MLIAMPVKIKIKRKQVTIIFFIIVILLSSFFISSPILILKKKNLSIARVASLKIYMKLSCHLDGQAHKYQADISQEARTWS